MPQYRGDYDGHDTEEKYIRLNSLTLVLDDIVAGDANDLPLPKTLSPLVEGKLAALFE